MDTRKKYGIAGIAAFSAFLTLIFIPGSFVAEAMSTVLVPVPPSHPRAQIPDTFAIEVNGSEDPVTMTVKRGESSQIQVAVTPLVKGIVGNITIMGQPVCGTTEIVHRCVAQGVSASISEDGGKSSTRLISGVTSAKTLTTTVTVAPDATTGKYVFEIIATTMLNIPTQAQPVETGFTYGFIVEVV